MTERDDRSDRPDRPVQPQDPAGPDPDAGQGRAPGFIDATHGHRGVPGDEVLAHEHARPATGQHDFEPDVERIHRSIAREAREPLEGREPVPWWVWVTGTIAIFWAGWYLGQHGGTFDPTPHIAFDTRRGPVAAAAAEASRQAVDDPLAAGERLYAIHCRACHQADGEGLAGVFPPVVGSDRVLGPPETLVRILLHGMQGPVEVAGLAYDGVMPAWQNQLSDQEIAAVASFIRRLGANDAPPVDPGLVASLRVAEAARTRPWTAQELAASDPGDRP